MRPAIAVLIGLALAALMVLSFAPVFGIDLWPVLGEVDNNRAVMGPILLGMTALGGWLWWSERRK